MYGWWGTRWSVLLTLTLMMALAGCGTAPVRAPETALGDAPGGHARAPGQRAVYAAYRQLGAPYRYGGTTPAGFDCSGLVQYAYRRAGIAIPRTTHQQLRHAHRVPLSALRPGDLLFFRLAPPKISHVGIYAGDGRFIHAPSSGKAVSYASLDNPYWRQHVVAAGRFY